MIIIDYKDTRPIYEQVVARFKDLILRGALQTDEQMPSVRSLAMELSINPNTIQKAYAQLERDGFIYVIKGRGNFVSGTGELLKEKRNSCLALIKQQVREAIELGVSKEEIVECIQSL